MGGIAIGKRTQAGEAICLKGLTGSHSIKKSYKLKQHNMFLTTCKNDPYKYFVIWCCDSAGEYCQCVSATMAKIVNHLDRVRIHSRSWPKEKGNKQRCQTLCRPIHPSQSRTPSYKFCGSMSSPHYFHCCS